MSYDQTNRCTYCGEHIADPHAPECPAERPTVTVYTAGPSCARCRCTIAALSRQGIPHAVVDLSADPAARDWIVNTLGYTEAPVVVIDGPDGCRSWSGHRPDAIDELGA